MGRIARAAVLALSLPAVASAGQVVLTAEPFPPPGSTCTGEAAAELRTGLSRLLMLDPSGARDAFARAERSSQECALAPWGLALATLGLPDTDASAADWQRAGEAVRRALAIRRASPAERELIEAARVLAEPGTPALSRLRAFAESSVDVAARRPGDGTAALVAALASLAIASLPGDAWERQAARLVAPFAPPAARDLAAATLRVLTCGRLRPAGPGDAPDGEEASACVAAARALVTMAPEAPRALHAAARVFQRAGSWGEAERADEDALEASGGIASQVWLRAGRWREHPLPWLVQADVERGRFASAHARLDAARARYAEVSGRLEPMPAWRLRGVIDLALMRAHWGSVDWQGSRPWPDSNATVLDAMAVAAPAGRPLAPGDAELWRETRASRALLAGLLAARAAWPRGEPERLAVARESASLLQALSVEAPAPPRMEWMRTAVLAATAAALEAREELALLLLQLDSLDRELAEAGVEGPTSADALAGEWHLQLRDLAQAAQRFGAAAAGGAGRARAWLGRARAELGASRRAAAEEAYRAFLAAWHAADESRPEAAEARAFVAQPRLLP